MRRWALARDDMLRSISIVWCGVLRNGQQPGSAMNIFIDQDKVEAMKTLSHRTSRGNKHQFHAKVTMST